MTPYIEVIYPIPHLQIVSILSVPSFVLVGAVVTTFTFSTS